MTCASRGGSQRVMLYTPTAVFALRCGNSALKICRHHRSALSIPSLILLSPAVDLLPGKPTGHPSFLNLALKQRLDLRTGSHTGNRRTSVTNSYSTAKRLVCQVQPGNDMNFWLHP